MSVQAADEAAARPLPPSAGSTPLPDASDDDLEGRGTLRLAPGVVARIAEVAASRVPGVLPVGSSTTAPVATMIPAPMPMGPVSDLGTRAVSASASVVDGAASIAITTGVEWPQPVADVAAAVARAVVEEVRRLTAVPVRDVSVDVVAIGNRPKRRVR